MPKIALLKGMLLFFWVAENGEPIHFHVVRGKPGEPDAKFWLTRSGGCILASNSARLSVRDIALVRKYAILNFDEICEQWANLFEEDPTFYC